MASNRKLCDAIYQKANRLNESAEATCLNLAAILWQCHVMRSRAEELCRLNVIALMFHALACQWSSGVHRTLLFIERLGQIQQCITF